ncbi:MAG: GTP 3',8-cyclase MoaA [Actinobacteria bacterium]|nr:GTP 3',8-cyclase MoaA [Actinomycetota bacterium]
MKDSFNRTIDYLRISITDRCNLKCIYCITSENLSFLPREQVLTYEEVLKVSRAAVKAGIRKIRITGGEPLVRRDIEELVSEISKIEGIYDLSLTTNGTLLRNYAERLLRAGLKRINISLDTLNSERFKQITGGGDLNQVLEGIDAAISVGMDPVKINTVLLDDGVEEEIDLFLNLVYRKPVHVRFIEKMDFDDDCGSTSSIKCSRLIELVSSRAKLKETEGPFGFGPATYFKPEGARGTIGFICPYSRHFCSRCNRLRLTADGKLRPCLFSDIEVDLRPILRDVNFKDSDLLEKIREALTLKPESFKQAKRSKKITMRQIGG